MSLRLAFTAVILCFILACEEHAIPGSSFTDTGLEYKILYLGDEEERPQRGEVVKFYWRVENEGGGHLRSGVQSVVYEGIKDTGFQEILSKLFIGDSAVFMADSAVAAAQNIPLKTAVSPLHIKPFALADTLEEKYESKLPGITAGVKNKSDRAFYGVLDTLLKKPVKEMNGMFMFLIRTQTSVPITPGSEVTLEYEGFLLNGKKIDSTVDRNDPFRFFAGDPEQLIPGLNMAVQAMSEGDEVVLVIPPHLAFGKGSGAGIVPPQSTVVYRVLVLNVKNKNV